MEAIIYNSTPQEEILSNRLVSKIKANSGIPQHIRDAVEDYSTVLTHPNSGKVAIPINRYGYYWPFIEGELTQTELNNIEILTNDWFEIIE